MAVYVVPTHMWGGCWRCSPTWRNCSWWWCWRSGRLLRDRNIRVITFVVVEVVARPKNCYKIWELLLVDHHMTWIFFFCQKDCSSGGKISSSKMNDDDDIFYSLKLGGSSPIPWHSIMFVTSETGWILYRALVNCSTT